MADNSVISFKVFLREDGNSDARRFTVDAGVVTNFFFMKEKIQTVFPTLRESEFKITWKDADGDEITITSDEDFITAFTEMSGNVKILYVTVLHRQTNPVFVEAETSGPSFSPQIVCDVCNQTITGFRYKCLQCPDYDLCAGCEYQGHHGEHLMMRVPHADASVPRCARKFVNHLARSLRKSAYATSREAYRSAKHCGKTASTEKPEEAGHASAEAHAKASASTTESDPSKGCPFGAAEGFNFNDVHALGAMARQHIGPILDAINNPNQGGNPQQQGGLIMDMIRNAMEGFFGPPEGTNEQNGQQEQPRESSAQQQAETTTSTKPSTGSVGETSPMDVENNVRPEQTVTFADAAKPTVQHPSTAQRPEPGWTFVAQNQTPQPTTNTAQTVPPNTPTAPAFIYHSNPVIAEALVQLHEMGFSNESGILTNLLLRFNGNVSQVVKTLIEMKI